MPKSNLFKLANRFEAKLESNVRKTGDLSSQAEISQKNLKKISKLERTLNTKIAKHQAAFKKYAASPTVKTLGGKSLPALYTICTTCQGHGRVAQTFKPAGVKIACATDYFKYYATRKCATCQGDRVLKMADASQCSLADLQAYEQYKLEKQAKDKTKKLTKQKKKAEKALKKALDLKVRAEDPEEYDRVKKLRKAAKKASKAEKKALKAQRKVDQAEAVI